MSHRLRPLLALYSCAAALTGCAAVPPQSEFSPQASALQFQDRRLDAVALGLPPVERWGFTELQHAAVRLNPRIAAATAGLEEARARKQSATQRRNPDLQLNLERAFSGGAQAWLYGAALELLQLRSGERERAQQLAALEELIAQADVESTIADVRTELRNALIELQQAAPEIQTRRRLVAARSALLTSIRTRTRAGDLASWEQLRAQVELAEAQALLRNAEATQTDARIRLAMAIGIPLAAIDLVPVDPRLDSPIATVPVDGPARLQALVRHREVQRALHQYAKADFDLRNEVARSAPALRVAPGYAWDQGERKLTLDTAFELPLFHRNEGPIAEALARRDTATHRLLEAQLQVYERIERAQTALQVAQAERADADAALQRAVQNHASESRRLAAGAADRPGVLAAELLMLEADLRVQRAQSAVMLASGTLEDTLRTHPPGQEDTPAYAIADP